MQDSSNFYPAKIYVKNGAASNDIPRDTIVQIPATASVIRSKYLSQVCAVLAVSLGTFAAGLGKGYSSPAIASLQDTQPAANLSGNITASSPELTVTSQQASWVASLSFLGALFGAIFSGVAMKFGRRNVLLAVSVPFSGSWMLTAIAFNVEMMYATSFIGGFCCAIVLTVSQVYISEISSASVRGSLNAVLKIFGQIGVLISFTMGAYLNWKWLAITICIAPMALFFAMLYMPETPSYLALQGRDREALKSLRWLKGSGSRSEYEIAAELASIKNSISRNKRRNTLNLRQQNQELINHELYQPILITCGLMFFQKFSGAHSFNFYAVLIFKQTFTGMNPHCGAIVVGFVQLLASLLSGLLIDTVGRLPLLVASSVLMSIALASFGSYSYFVKQTLIQYDLIPLICVLMFTVAFSIGISPISWLMVGELFPLEYRGLGSSIAMSFSYACAFVNVKTFVDFQQLFGLHGTYWLYSACSVVGLCFVVCCVPETKGRDLEEMDQNNSPIVRT